MILTSLQVAIIAAAFPTDALDSKDSIDPPALKTSRSFSGSLQGGCLLQVRPHVSKVSGAQLQDDLYGSDVPGELLIFDQSLQQAVVSNPAKRKRVQEARQRREAERWLAAQFAKEKAAARAEAAKRKAEAEAEAAAEEYDDNDSAEATEADQDRAKAPSASTTMTTTASGPAGDEHTRSGSHHGRDLPRQNGPAGDKYTRGGNRHSRGSPLSKGMPGGRSPGRWVPGEPCHTFRWDDSASSPNTVPVPCEEEDTENVNESSTTPASVTTAPAVRRSSSGQVSIVTTTAPRPETRQGVIASTTISLPYTTAPAPP